MPQLRHASSNWTNWAWLHDKIRNPSKRSLEKDDTLPFQRGGIPLNKRVVKHALTARKLDPYHWPPNYGRKTHIEVCDWVGVNPSSLSLLAFESRMAAYLDNGLSYRANRCLSRAGVLATKESVREALLTGALSPGTRPSNYGRKTHAELCSWAGTDSVVE